MMETKLLEIRDEGTFIPALCVDMNLDVGNAGYYLLRRVGYPCNGRPNIAMTRLSADGAPCWNDPYGWSGRGRTFPIAHKWIIKHWRELKSGDVVDVSFILGETETPKLSERITDSEAQ